MPKTKETSPKKRKQTLGQRAADWITYWCGTWTFILGLFAFLGVWMAINVIAYFFRWDPYPFILLNLMLSCLAAVQAPIILMSQNRSAERDRKRFEYDYAVNRKAEREVTDMQKDLEIIKDLIRTVQTDYSLNLKTDKSVEHLKRHITDVKKNYKEATQHLKGLRKDLHEIKKNITNT